MTDLWTEASIDVEAEHLDRHVTTARVASAAVWPFLAVATSEVEYANRKALVADRIDRIAAAAAESDPVLFGVVRAALEDGFDQDFAVLHGERVAAARIESLKTTERKQAEAAIHEAAEREVLEKVLAYEVPKASGGDCTNCGHAADKHLGNPPYQACSETTSSDGRRSQICSCVSYASGDKTAARDTGTCGVCGRATSYDSASKSWSHDNEGPDTQHKVTKASLSKSAFQYKGLEYGTGVVGEAGSVGAAAPVDCEVCGQPVGDNGWEEAYVSPWNTEGGQKAIHRHCGNDVQKSSARKTAGDSVEVDHIPNCDVCKKNKAAYDSRLPGLGGSWGHVCEDCFHNYGPGQTGTGHAQRLVQKAAAAMPSVDDIMRYEQDEMDDDEIVSFFQGLIDSGMAWKLQGSYGRTAQSLIEQGLCHTASKTAAFSGYCGEGRHDECTQKDCSCKCHKSKTAADDAPSIEWVEGTAPSGATYFKATKDGYNLDVRPLRDGEGTPGNWGWSVTGDGANGPRNKHGQAANRSDAERIALGIVKDQQGFTMETSRKTAAADGDTSTCKNCGKSIEDDDGIWYHTESMQMRCDGDDDEEGIGWGDMARSAEPKEASKTSAFGEREDGQTAVRCDQCGDEDLGRPGHACGRGNCSGIYRAVNKTSAKTAAFPPPKGGDSGNPFGQKKPANDGDAGAPDHAADQQGGSWQCPSCGSSNAYTQGGVDLDEALKAHQPIQCGDCKQVDPDGGQQKDQAGTVDANGAVKQDHPSPGQPPVPPHHGSRLPFSDRTTEITYVAVEHPRAQAVTAAAFNPIQPGIADDQTDGPHFPGAAPMDPPPTVQPETTRPRVVPDTPTPAAPAAAYPGDPAAPPTDAPADPAAKTPPPKKAAGLGFHSAAFKEKT